MIRKWLIIKSNYVIDTIIWDGIDPYTYPYPHDLMIEDITYEIGVGDWYEASENIFYRPLTLPPDFPGLP